MAPKHGTPKNPAQKAANKARHVGFHCINIYIFPKGLREDCNFQGVKSDSKNEKRTKKMSIFRKPKGILNITFCRTTLQHNALNCEKKYEKSVSIFLNIICRKGLGVFSVLLI